MRTIHSNQNGALNTYEFALIDYALNKIVSLRTNRMHILALNTKQVKMRTNRTRTKRMQMCTDVEYAIDAH